METIRHYTYSSLKEQFISPKDSSRPGIYLHFHTDCTDDDIRKCVKHCQENKIGLIIPVFGESFEFISPMRLLHRYAVLLEEASKLGMTVALNLENEIEGAVVRFFDDDDMDIRSKVLTRREYSCSANESVAIPIPDTPLAVVAVEERGDLIDLRPFINEKNELVWTAPHGNWRICRYKCAHDTDIDKVNMLSYDASKKYIDTVIELFKNTMGIYFGSTLRVIAFSDICFSSRNRRNWDNGYNDAFIKEFGFDGSVYYPCLYGCPEESMRRYKAMLMQVRASMLKDGIMKALYDAASENGMDLLGSLCEPKLSAPSAVTGDPVLCQSYAPCAKLEKAYLYGLNSLKLAAGAAELYDNKRASCEAFHGYKNRSENLIFRESAIAFSRGITFLAYHVPQIKPGELPMLIQNGSDRKFSEYLSRLNSVLEFGTPIYDASMLYPIHTLHASVSLYDMPTHPGAFEYPETPDTTDYMSVINNIESCAGISTRLIHPLKLKEELDRKELKALILPAMSVISTENMREIAEFFDRGGKIIATGVLPTKAAEIPKDGKNIYDDEVCRLIHHVFGNNAFGEIIDKDYVRNKNESGGDAIFLHSTATGIDRCNAVPGKKIAAALEKLGLPSDVKIEGFDCMADSGAFNLNYPDYAMLGLTSKFRGRGKINYIHKRNEDADIYFFSTIDIEGNGRVLLKDRMIPELWNPETGEISALKYEYVTENGVTYTKIPVEISFGKSLMIIGKHI